MSAIPLSRIEGKYEILEKLREGGMGAIYKVRHRLLEEVRVVKLMRPQFTQDEELKARFVREARLAIKLRHPNIAQLYDFTVDEEDDTAFIVMEYIEGMNLEDVVAANGPLPLGIALEIAQQSLRAIGYLHAKGFIHRDISPDNLMLTEDADGQPLVKLIDLGIAKGQDGGGESNLTQAGTFLGKVRYASPEQFGSEGAVSTDARSDLYSFGIVLYELLTARYPIQGRDPTSLIAGHLFRPPLDFADTDPHGRVPEGVRSLVLRALAKPPADRFASAQEFSRALGACRSPSDLPEEEVRKLLARSPRAVDFPVVPPGSTQDRLDQQFGLSTTPTPNTLELARTELSPDTRRDGAEERGGEASQVRQSVATISLQLDRRDLLTAEAELRWAEDSFGDHPDLRALRQRLQDLRAREAAEQARALLAEARGLLAADPEQALDKALQARALDPANPDLADLLRQAESAQEARHEERRRAEEAATAAEIGEIEAALERGDLRRAEALLYGAEARLGDHADFAALHGRLAERRRRDLEARRQQEEAAGLLARALELAAQNDFKAALKELRRAERLAPEDLVIQAEIEANEQASRRRTTEKRRAGLAARSAAAVESRLEAGELDEAEKLLTRALGSYGEDEALVRLRGRLEASRLEAAAVRQEKEAARQEAESAERRADVEKRRAAKLAAAAQEIQEHLDRGELERTAELLDEAVVRFGVAPALREGWERLESLRRARKAEKAQQDEEEQRAREAAAQAAAAVPPPAAAVSDDDAALWESIHWIAGLISLRENERALKELHQAAIRFGDREEIQSLRKRIAEIVLAEEDEPPAHRPGRPPFGPPPPPPPSAVPPGAAAPEDGPLDPAAPWWKKKFW